MAPSEPSAEDDVDRLYQMPLAEFTAARDALAKRSGADAARIRKLQKPAAPAWAVNQLYWTRRKVFDRLTNAIAGVRAEHAKRLAGKTADVERAELLHGAALQAAVSEAQSLLAASGDAVTAATTTAITETLQALPWPEPPGRLVRPVRPQGFAALAGLLPKGAAAERVAEVVALDRRRREQAQSETRAERATRENAERRQEAAAIARALRAAEAAERKTEQALAHVRERVVRAEAARDRLARALAEADEELQALKSALGERQREAREAAAETARLEQRSRALADGPATRSDRRT